MLTLYDCAGVLTVDDSLVTIVSTIVTVIKIAIPVILVIFGMMDLGKAVMAQKEDEIKKGQQTFIKRLIAAAIVFFVFFIVQIVFGLVASGEPESQSMWNCVNAFINGIPN